MHNFRKLQVYQKSLDLSKNVRKATIASEIKYITKEQHKGLFEQIDEISAMLIGFQRTLSKQ